VGASSLAGTFDENEHPRDKKGEFVTKEGVAARVAALPAAVTGVDRRLESASMKAVAEGAESLKAKSPGVFAQLHRYAMETAGGGGAREGMAALVARYHDLNDKAHEWLEAHPAAAKALSLAQSAGGLGMKGTVQVFRTLVLSPLGLNRLLDSVGGFVKTKVATLTSANHGEAFEAREHKDVIKERKAAEQAKKIAEKQAARDKVKVAAAEVKAKEKAGRDAATGGKYNVQMHITNAQGVPLGQLGPGAKSAAMLSAGQVLKVQKAERVDGSTVKVHCIAMSKEQALQDHINANVGKSRLSPAQLRAFFAKLSAEEPEAGGPKLLGPGGG